MKIATMRSLRKKWIFSTIKLFKDFEISSESINNSPKTPFILPPNSKERAPKINQCSTIIPSNSREAIVTIGLLNMIKNFILRKIIPPHKGKCSLKASNPAQKHWLNKVSSNFNKLAPKKCPATVKSRNVLNSTANASKTGNSAKIATASTAITS